MYLWMDGLDGDGDVDVDSDGNDDGGRCAKAAGVM